jgi:hypothetical protein
MKFLDLLTEQNIALITLVLSGFLSAISGILELSGKTGWSKVIGTVSVADIGRVLRFVKRLVDERKAAKVAKVTSIMLAFLVLPGCSILKSPDFWDAAEKACVLAMTARPEVVAEAQARKLTGQEWATVICKISDVIEPFVVDPDPKSAADRAVLLARPRGLVR